MTTTAATDFVPADLDGRTWDALEPYYRALLDRDLPDAKALERLILDRSELDAAAHEAYATLYIDMTCRTDDEAARDGYLNFVEHVEPTLKQVGFELDTKIAECPHAAALDQERYGVLLRSLQTDVELFREENIPLQTEETKLGQRYSETCGAMTVEFRGATKTLPQMSPYMEETERATREEAWRLVSQRRLADRATLDDIFEQMLAVRGRIAANAGKADYRDYAFAAKHRFDYGPAECEAFHRAAEELVVPLVAELNRERAELLGVDALRPWDLAVDVHGRAPLRPFSGADELIERSSKLFHRLEGGDAGLGALFDTMRDGTSLDLEARPGKAPGGYQQSLDRRRRPFIFMNAAGTQRDVDTMIHEAGHAFHSMLCSDDPIRDYRHAPIEFAEVASMSMELLAHPYLDEFYSAGDVDRARRTHLEGIIRFLPWCATIDAFQHWLYTNPGHDLEARTAQWIELQDRFAPGVDWSGLEDARAAGWHRQLHIFEVPFYYIEYGIAQLGSLQLWLQAREDEGRALESYRRAMALGGSRPLPALFAAADLEFDFGPATVRRLVDAVREELAQLPA